MEPIEEVVEGRAIWSMSWGNPVLLNELIIDITGTRSGIGNWTVSCRVRPIIVCRSIIDSYNSRLVGNTPVVKANFSSGINRQCGAGARLSRKDYTGNIFKDQCSLDLTGTGVGKTIGNLLTFNVIPCDCHSTVNQP